MSKAKGTAEYIQEPGYKMFYADTMALLDAINSCGDIVEELCYIPVDAPSAEELSSAKLICDCLCAAVFNTIPCPAYPAPLGVPGPSASNAADPEYTYVLPISPGRREDAFETTTIRYAFNFDVKTEDPEFKATCGIPVKTGTYKRGPPQPLRSPSNTSKTPATYSRAYERPSFMGTFDLIRADRPPSATDVRYASKRKADELQKLYSAKYDVGVIRQARLDEMARALAAEAKGGRKLEKLPEDAYYICDDDGRIVGVGFQKGKNYTETVSSAVYLKKEYEKRTDSRAEAASYYESRKSLLDETKARYNHSLYGKDIAQANSRYKRRF